MKLAELMAMPLGEVLLSLVAPRPAVDDDPWIDSRAEECPVPHRTLLAAAQRGELVLCKLRRRYLVRRSELDRWIELHQVVATQSTGGRTAAETEAERILRLNGYGQAGHE